MHSLYVYIRYARTMLFSLSHVLVVSTSLSHMYKWISILGRWPRIAEINLILYVYCILFGGIITKHTDIFVKQRQYKQHLSFRVIAIFPL